MRTLSPRLFIAAFALAVLSSGCTDPCVALCEDNKECPDADVSINCTDQCEAKKTNIEGQNCLAEYEDLVDCQTGLDDVCTPGDQCAEPQATFDTCVTNACTADPTLAGCP